MMGRLPWAPVKCSTCVSWDGPDPSRGAFVGICIAGRGEVHGDEYHPMCYQRQFPENGTEPPEAKRME